MMSVALKMLIGDRAKYLGIIMGITFASLLITQQLAIFNGLMSRTYGAVSDMGLPDIWVMDPKVQFIDDIKPLQDTELYRVRGIEGVEWSVPLYKGLLKARLGSGEFQTCNVFGIDDASLIGGPPEMVEGTLADLRRADAVIIDDVGAEDKLAKLGPHGKLIPVKVGDTLELNDHRAVVVGICKVSRTFQSQPVVYTTYTRAIGFAPRERRLLSFVLVKAKPGVDTADLCKRIEKITGLTALTGQGLKDLTFDYFFKRTGIPINFFMAVALGFVVGTAIAGQTFYNFTLDNLKHFGALKAMGASNGLLLKMILVQSVVVGLIGYGLGVGGAAWMGHALRNSELAFKMPMWLLAFTGGSVLIICCLASLLSLRKVMRLEPAIVFKG